MLKVVQKLTEELKEDILNHIKIPNTEEFITEEEFTENFDQYIKKNEKLIRGALRLPEKKREQ